MFQQKNASHPSGCTTNAQSKTLVMLINPLNAIITSNSQSSSKRQKNHDLVKLQHFAFNASERLRFDLLIPQNFTTGGRDQRIMIQKGF